MSCPTEQIGGLGVRVAGDAALPPTVPHTAEERAGTVKARTVHRTSSKELVKVLGHRCLERLRRR
ncbi:hypothetical protein [Streptomyces swartbergensis]|uniref:Uncharacterized protein n=1 Tax=Streptomyces swartbergensis TaxID=487165 RepID=A0A243RZ09_9ACTN|nr:hypothetical protein [Streptomyces swartbergensis]OUD00434.1 hypothetical protein CA983_25580 [Streptomyces swartbergensis]